MNKILQGNVFDRLKDLNDESVQCVVTSPPYWGLRDYRQDEQLGLEKTPEKYVENMVKVFREVKRVLKHDGTVWLNLGDSYASKSKGDKRSAEELSLGSTLGPNKDGLSSHNMAFNKNFSPMQFDLNGLKAKDLVGIPWRVAFALQADGWYLRQDIIWHKPNPMPESVQDRCTKSHEYIFLLTKSAKYFYDNDAIREPYTEPMNRWGGEKLQANGESMWDKGTGQHTYRTRDMRPNETGRNKRSVWSINTKPYKEAHFAVFPPKIPELCIKAGTSEYGECSECGKAWERIIEKERTFESGSGKSGNMPSGKNGPDLQGGGETLDIRRGPVVHITTKGWQPTCSCDADRVPQIVLDPFFGSGTTGWVAQRLGRKWIGIELNEEYIKIAERRFSQKELFA